MSTAPLGGSFSNKKGRRTFRKEQSTRDWMKEGQKG